MTENLPMVPSLTLSQQIAAASEKVLPPSSEEITRALLTLRNSGAAFPDGITEEGAQKVYGYVLMNVPSAALKKAVKKFVTGEYENMDYRYIPRPPELAAMARAGAKSMYEDIRRLKDTKAAIDLVDYVPSNPNEPSSISRARKRWAGMKPIDTDITLDTWAQNVKQAKYPVGAVFSCILGNVYSGPSPDDAKVGPKAKAASEALRKWREDRKAGRNKFNDAADVETEEQRDHWQRISAMPDAKNVTAEHEAFRSRINAKINTNNG